MHPIYAFLPLGQSPSAVGKCAKSVILPPDYLGSTGSSPLPSASPSLKASSSSSSSLTPWLLAAGFLGALYWAVSRVGVMR